MTNAKVTWKGKQVLAEIKDATPEGLFAAAQAIIDAARAKAPRGDSGRLQESGYVATRKQSTYKAHKLHRKEVRPTDDNTAVAAFAIFYAGFVEYGTRGGKIGRAGQVLRLANGKFVRGPITHPGVRARPFLRPAFDEQRESIKANVARVIRTKRGNR